MLPVNLLLLFLFFLLQSGAEMKKQIQIGYFMCDLFCKPFLECRRNLPEQIVAIISQKIIQRSKRTCFSFPPRLVATASKYYQNYQICALDSIALCLMILRTFTSMVKGWEHVLETGSGTAKRWYWYRVICFLV